MIEDLKKHWQWAAAAAVLIVLWLIVRSRQAAQGGGGISASDILHLEAQQATEAAQASNQRLSASVSLAGAALAANAQETSAYYNTVQSYYTNYFQAQEVASASGAAIAQANATAQAQVEAAHAAAGAQGSHDAFTFAAALLPFIFCDHDRADATQDPPAPARIRVTRHVERHFLPTSIAIGSPITHHIARWGTRSRIPHGSARGMAGHAHSGSTGPGAPGGSHGGHR